MSDANTQQRHLSTHLSRHADDMASRVFNGHDGGFCASATLDVAWRFAPDSRAGRGAGGLTFTDTPACRCRVPRPGAKQAERPPPELVVPTEA